MTVELTRAHKFVSREFAMLYSDHSKNTKK